MQQLKFSSGLPTPRSVSPAFISCNPVQTTSSRLCLCACLPRDAIHPKMAALLLLIWQPKSTTTKSLTVLVSELSQFEFCLLLGKYFKPSSQCPFHWCCFLQNTSSLVFGLVMTRAHCTTAGTVRGASTERFSACSSSSASPAWKYCHFFALHPTLNGAADKGI